MTFAMKIIYIRPGYTMSFIRDEDVHLRELCDKEQTVFIYAHLS